MTERVRTLTVYLTEPKREDDDAQVVMDAIKMIKGVDNVVLGEGDWEHYHAIQAVRTELGDGLHAVLQVALYPEFMDEDKVEALHRLYRKAERQLKR